jgi:type IV secretory pathway protease TraF
MQPTFQPGDTLLGWKGWRVQSKPAHYAPGIVVVVDIEGQLAIKRLATVSPVSERFRTITVVGDNAADSRDSRHYGAIAIEQIKAVIVAKLP